MKSRHMMNLARLSLMGGLSMAVMSVQSASLADVYRDVVRETQVEINAANQAVATQRTATQVMKKDQHAAEAQKEALATEVATLEAELIAAQARVKEARARLEQEKAGTKALFETLDRHERLMKDAVLKTPLGRDVAPLMDKGDMAKSEARLERFKTHWLATMKAIVASGEVTHFEAQSMFDEKGTPIQEPVTRYGAFGSYGESSGWLTYLPAERSWQALKDAPTFESGLVALDPTYGERLKSYSERHSAFAWLKPAGFVGVLIGLVALVALILGALRWWRLTSTLSEVRREAERETPDTRNPLGRLRAAATEESDELLEARLDAALVAERPTLNRGISMLAVLAGIPTLLGLLGTVSGMIETFGVMSAHGSADPGLLAGGIAEALITTELGLITAIPILLLHCALKNRSDALVATLEEAAATLAVREAHGCCGACHTAGSR